VGQYQMDVALGVHDIPRFLGPHLSVSKRACWGDEKTIRFRINVTNNGNRTLAPVEVIDMLPEGLSLQNSTLRPKVDGRNLSWSWLSLPVGRTYTIELYARWDGQHGPSTNRVLARGQHEGCWIEASASCSTGKFRRLPKGDRTREKKAGDFSGGDWRPSSCLQMGTNLSTCFEMYYEDSYRDADADETLCRCTSTAT
jgi:uncharacterized repeat protein (TIGR01451 family)